MEKYLKDTNKLKQKEYRDAIVARMQATDDISREWVREDPDCMTLIKLIRISFSFSRLQPRFYPRSANKQLEEQIRKRIKRQEVEEQLVWLQIDKQIYIRETKNANDTADFIARFTLTLAEEPYR